MNVDKFGHHVHKRLRVSSDNFNSQFVLLRSENGDYNFHSSNLKEVKTPIDLNDAVNKEYVDQALDKYCTIEQMQRELTNLKSNLLLLVNKKLESYYRDREKNKNSLKNE